MTSPTDPDRFNALAERSKNDREMIVGSEVREVVQAYSIVCKLLAAKREDHLTACKIASDKTHENAAILALLAEARESADVMSNALGNDECTIHYEDSLRERISAVIDPKTPKKG